MVVRLSIGEPLYLAQKLCWFTSCLSYAVGALACRFFLGGIFGDGIGMVTNCNLEWFWR